MLSIEIFILASPLRALLFGGAGNSKGPILLFMISVLLWGYPMYLLKCIPLTWNLLRGSHYCFIYWNIVMWISWIVANRRDPGYVPQNSETYYRAIKQVFYNSMMYYKILYSHFT